jgi:hypothetical protein
MSWITRRVTHLIQWADYQSGAGAQPSGSPARLTIYSLSPDGDHAAVEGSHLERAA